MLVTSTILLSSIIGFVNTPENIAIEKPITLQSPSLLIDNALLQEETSHEQLLAQFGQSDLTPAEKIARDRKEMDKRRQMEIEKHLRNSPSLGKVPGFGKEPGGESLKERMADSRRRMEKRKAEAFKRREKLEKIKIQEKLHGKKGKPAHNINRNKNQPGNIQNKTIEQVFDDLDKQADEALENHNRLGNQPPHNARNHQSVASDSTPRYGLMIFSVVIVFLFLGAGYFFFMRNG